LAEHYGLPLVSKLGPNWSAQKGGHFWNIIVPFKNVIMSILFI